MKFRKKAAQGVDFFMSHPLFDLKNAGDFLEQTPEIKTPVLVTVCLLKWEQVADYRPGNIPGVFLPEGVLEEFQAWKEETYESQGLGFRR